MRDFSDEFELDEDGRLRRKRVARDGERCAFTMEMMDAAAGFHRTFSDGSVDHTHWSRPGFRFADTNDPNRLAAEEAYEARRRRTHYTSKHRQQAEDHTPPARTLTIENARQLAEDAYRAKVRRLDYRSRGGSP